MSNISSSVTDLLSSNAYLLVFHGSRDCQTHEAISTLKELVVAECLSMNILTQQNYLEKNLGKLSNKTSFIFRNSEFPMIETAALELGEFSLSQRLLDFAVRAEEQGYKKIKVIPLFLAPGTHVQLDIPEEIAEVRQHLSSNIIVELSPYLGKYSGIVPLINDHFRRLKAEAKILVAHGTRLAAGKAFYQNLANQLSSELAYWSSEPKLNSQIEKLVMAGAKKIAIQPYFLFPGRITKAIAKDMNQFRSKFLGTELVLGEPIGTTKTMAQLMAQLMATGA